MFMKAVIAADDGRSIPIMTMGRSVLHRSLKGRGMERFYWIILWKKQKSLDAEQYALKEILIFTVRVDSDRQASMVSVIMDCRREKMHHSFCVKSLYLVILMGLLESMQHRKAILWMSRTQKNLISSFHNYASWYRFCACWLSVYRQ